MTEAMVRGAQKTINECIECASERNRDKAESLQGFIIDTYGIIIPNLYKGLSSYIQIGDDVDWLGDLIVLNKKLEFFLATEGGYALNKNSDGKDIIFICKFVVYLKRKKYNYWYMS